MELATTTGLTAYDASYVWLTRQLGADLVTLDQRPASADASLRRLPYARGRIGSAGPAEASGDRG
ncbi:MAG: type II toxin-antitoxin system VapC family toxin, partial [Acetobacteraceae bacterium]